MMIKSTFCHLPGISLSDEKEFWRKGIRTWDDLLCWASVYCSDARYNALQTSIAESQAAIELQDPGFFLKMLPEPEWYRVYRDFFGKIHCLDIETDSLSEDAAITCLTILNGTRLNTFVEGENLELASEALNEIVVVVTFNGTRFDIPRLLRRFPDFSPKFHIDLADILKARKIRGSLKNVACQFGWQNKSDFRKITDGEEAARTWLKFKESGDQRQLEVLKAYNQSDVQMLDFILRVLTQRLRQISES